MRAPMPAPVLRPVPQPRSRNVSCCWPIGEPGTKSFRFCDAEATPNKPYCNEHAQLAYVKVRDRRDEAAA
jgi:GcrA cell cycle regulator